MMIKNFRSISSVTTFVAFRESEWDASRSKVSLFFGASIISNLIVYILHLNFQHKMWCGPLQKLKGVLFSFQKWKYVRKLRGGRFCFQLRSIFTVNLPSWNKTSGEQGGSGKAKWRGCHQSKPLQSLKTSDLYGFLSWWSLEGAFCFDCLDACRISSRNFGKISTWSEESSSGSCTEWYVDTHRKERPETGQELRERSRSCRMFIIAEQLLSDIIAK